jgi:hypothetical protein
MNKVFASKLTNGSTGLSEGGDGQGLSLEVFNRAPGTIPAHVNPPRPSDSLLAGTPEEPKIAVTASSTPAAARVATAAPPEQSEGLFSGLARKMGFSSDSAPSAPTPAAAPAKPKLAEGKPPRPEASIPKAKAAETKHAARPPLKPSISDQPAETAAAPAPPSTITGAQPIVQANSFEGRFSAAK